MKNNRSIRKTLLHFFVLSCEKATLLMEKEVRGALNPVERWQLRLHLRLCKNCRCYHTKMEVMEAFLKNAEDRAQTVFSKEEVEEVIRRTRRKGSCFD